MNMHASPAWHALARRPRPTIAPDQLWRTPDGSRLRIVRAVAGGRWDIDVEGAPWLNLKGETGPWLTRVGWLDGFCYLSPVERACKAWFGSHVLHNRVKDVVHTLLYQLGWDGAAEIPALQAFTAGAVELIPPGGWIVNAGGGSCYGSSERVLLKYLKPGSVVCSSGAGSPYDESESWGLPFDVGHQ